MGADPVPETEYNIYFNTVHDGKIPSSDPHTTVSSSFMYNHFFYLQIQFSI
jgi:hypothetical protein